MREADFSERIKTILCERVGGRCSNPNCRIFLRDCQYYSIELM